MTTLVKAGFDYGALDPAVADEARAVADRIHTLGQRQNEAVVAIGRELNAIKDRLGHGHFGGWLRAEFELSADTAERYMRLAAVLDGKFRTVRILKPTTLYALTAKAIPETVRGEIVEQIEAGEPVSDSEVCDTVRRAVTEARKIDLKKRRLPALRSTPKLAEPPTQSRAKAIVDFSKELHRHPADTLADLTRILCDERRRIDELPLQKRVVLACGFLQALGITLAQLRSIEDEP